MSNPIEQQFVRWFHNFIKFDTNKAESADNLYKNYCDYASKNEILPLSRKKFTRALSIRLKPEMDKGKVDTFRTRCTQFRGLCLEKDPF